MLTRLKIPFMPEVVRTMLPEIHLDSRRFWWSSWERTTAMPSLWSFILTQLGEEAECLPY